MSVTTTTTEMMIPGTTCRSHTNRTIIMFIKIAHLFHRCTHILSLLPPPSFLCRRSLDNRSPLHPADRGFAIDQNRLVVCRLMQNTSKKEQRMAVLNADGRTSLGGVLVLYWRACREGGVIEETFHQSLMMTVCMDSFFSFLIIFLFFEFFFQYAVQKCMRM